MNSQADATRAAILAKFQKMTEQEQQYMIDFVKLLLDKRRYQSAEQEAAARGMSLSEYEYQEYQKTHKEG